MTNVPDETQNTPASIPLSIARRTACRNKRTKLAKAIDRKYIEDKSLEGWGLAEITEGLNSRPGAGYTLSVEQVRSDLRKVEAEWVLERLTDRDKWVARAIKVANKLLKALWEQWRKSLQDFESTRQKGKPEVDLRGFVVRGEDGKPRINVVEVNKIKEGRVGAVDCLRLILDVEARLAKLLGYDAPVRVDARAEINVTHQYEQMSEADLLALMASRMELMKQIVPVEVETVTEAPAALTAGTEQK